MREILPVITLYQPWATWIMRGWKTIETRTHSRFAILNGSDILIHAGQKTDDSDLTVKNPYLTHEQIIYNPDEVVNGFILGKATVDNTKWLNENHSKRALIDCGDINVPRFGLFLSSIEKFETPIPVKGNMGIWYYDLTNKQKVLTTKNKLNYGKDE